jgi:hypothetical protein
MRRVTFLLRVWVLVGTTLLLLPIPGMLRGDTSGFCIQPVRGTANCPSGCTIGSFPQYTQEPGSNGTWYLKDNGPAPCGTAKQGQSCSPPLEWYPVGDYQNCCTKLGYGGCTGNYNTNEYLACCDTSPVECVAGICCLPDGSQGCTTDGDCCNYPCVNGKCRCIPRGQYCGSNPDACCPPYTCDDGCWACM